MQRVAGQGEDLGRAPDQRGEIEAVVIRLSNVLGAPADRNVNCRMLLVNDLCRQAVTRQQMVLCTSGLQRRDFIPMGDACRTIKHLLNLARSELENRIFNLGGMWSPTVWEMARIIQQRCKIVLGFKPDIIRPPPKTHGLTNALDYRIDRLTETGFQLKADRVAEIDSLLRFCKAEFS